MRFRASPLVVAVALGLLGPAVLEEEEREPPRERTSRPEPPVESSNPTGDLVVTD